MLHFMGMQNMSALKKLGLSLAAVLLLASSASCKLNETEKYAQNLPEQTRAVVSQLEYDANTKALIDELYALQQSLQVHEETLNYLKEVCGDEKVDGEEVAGIRQIDHDRDGLSLQQEQELETDPLKPNPNVKYVTEKYPALTPYISQIKVMDDDGEQDENDISKIDLAYKITQFGWDVESNKKIIGPMIVYPDFENTLKQLSAVSDKALRDLLVFYIDENIMNYISFVSSLPDKDFVKYVLENKLCIQDRNLTELEKSFLKEPDNYIQQLFDNYISEIDKINPELAMELLKLPDFETVDIKDIEALEDILYSAKESEYKKFFEDCMNEGIEDKRIYCSPLEALLWIAYDNELDHWDLSIYSPESLTRSAWKYSSTSYFFRSERWQNFDEVVDRLNSPDLLVIYMDNNFSYDWKKHERWVAGDHSWDMPLDTFKNKKSDCGGQAIFALYCLLENGYMYDNFDTYRNNVASLLGCWDPSNPQASHTVLLYKENNVFYTIDSGETTVTKGSFATIEDAADATFIGWRQYIFYDVNARATKIVNK